MTVRFAVLSDQDRVVELLRDSRIGAGFDTPLGVSGFTFPFRPDHAARLFVAYLGRADRLAIVHDVAGVAQGILLAHAYDYDFGPVRLAQERLWWINPTHRGGTAAVRMLDAYEDWARSEGCDFTGMAGMGDDPDVGALYRRRGYRVAERNFLKGLAT